MARRFPRPTREVVRYAQSVRRPRIEAPIIALLASALTGCDEGSPTCKEGYALDSEGRCQVVSDDDDGTNTAPTAPSLQLQPEAPRAQSSDLVCVIASESVDVDGDDVTYTFSWTVDGVPFSDATATSYSGDTVPQAMLDAGSQWECAVTPTDGMADGPTASASVTVGEGYRGWDEQSISLSDADYTLVGEDGGGCFGASMAPAGDLDHDGKMDIIVGDYWWDHPDEGIDAGKAYVFLGADLGAGGQISASDAAWAFEAEFGRLEDDPDCEDSADEFERCGGDWVAHSVGGGMDGDGDGTADLLVSAYKSDHGAYDRGKVVFYSGANLGSRGTRSIGDADVQVFGETESDSMGHSVSWAGDVDGDGISELVTGSDRHSGTGFSAGRTYLVMSGKLSSGTDLQFPDDADYMWDGEVEDDQSAKRNVHVGDIDGDGMADIATVSIKNQSNGIGSNPLGERRGSGKFYILMSSDINATPRGTLMNVADASMAWMGEEGGDAMGYGVDLVGDFDGDGRDDLCAGSFGHSANGDASGKSYIITGADMPTPAVRVLSEASYGFVGEAENNWSGLAVSPAGDIDRDGRADLAIGSMGYSSSDKEMVGRSYLFFSQTTEPGTHQVTDADHIFEGERAWDGAGYRTRGPGDINGDGLDDLLVSAWQGDAPDESPGRVYIMLNP